MLWRARLGPRDGRRAIGVPAAIRGSRCEGARRSRGFRRASNAGAEDPARAQYRWQILAAELYESGSLLARWVLQALQVIVSSSTRISAKTLCSAPTVRRPVLML